MHSLQKARPSKLPECSELISPRRRAVLEKLLVPRGPEEHAILRQNQKLRTQAKIAAREDKTMHLEVSFPPRHLEAIKWMIPEMRSDAEKDVRVRAWKRFLGDPLSRPYRVQ